MVDTKPLYRFNCFFLIGLFLLVVSFQAFSIERYSFYRMKDEEQFSPNTITTLLQDRYGFLWIGTTEGLYRYNGLSYEAYVNEPQRPSSLPNNHVTAIIEDRNGGLWVGTARGEIVFLPPDYRNFQFKYKVDDNNLSHVLSLHQTQQGQIIAAYDSLLVVMNEQTRQIKTYQREKNPSLSIPGLELEDDKTISSSEPIIQVAEDRANRIYVLLGDKIYLYDDSKSSFLDIQLKTLLGNQEVYFTSFLIDHDNSLWIGTESHGLLHYQPNFNRLTLIDSSKNPRYDDLKETSVTSIVRGDKNKLWIGTEGKGLFLLDTNSDELLHFEENQFDRLSLEGKHVNAILQDQRGTLWIGSNNLGLIKSPLKDKKIGRITRHRLSNQGLIGNIIYSMKRNAEKWLIASAGGISEYDENKAQFEQLDIPPIRKRGSAYLIQPVGNNVLWYVIENEKNEPELYYWNRQGNRHRRIEIKTNENEALTKISLLTRDLEDNIWVSSNLGLHKFLGVEAIQCRESLEEVPITESAEIAEESNSPPPTPESTNCTNQVSLSWEELVNAAIENDREIGVLFEQRLMESMYASGKSFWFGTSNGLVKYDNDSKKFAFFMKNRHVPNSISSNIIYHITEDKLGNLWLATANGINSLSKENRVSNVNQFNAITESYYKFGSVYSILFDEKDRLWLSTNRGLFRYNTKTKDTRLYNRYDGMNSDVFVKNAAIKSRNGDLLFGSKSGIAVVLAQVEEVNIEPAKTIISDIKVRNRLLKLSPWYQTLPLELGANDNDITVYFSQTDYNHPKRNLFEYRLKGFKNSTWTEALDTPFAVYTNIPAGDYLFEVRSTSPELEQNTASFPIVVVPPLHLRWWSILFYVLAISFAIFYFIHRQQKRLEEQQKINEQLNRLDKLKDEFLANTSHELRTPLNGIIGLAESLLEGVTGELSAKTKDHLRLIVHSGNRLAQLVNEILDFKKLSYNNMQLEVSPVYLHPFIEIVYTSCLPLVKEKNIRLTNEVPSNIPPIDADGDRLQQILYNLIDNAIKYTNSGEVIISADFDDEKVRIKVTDSGIGISEADLARIFEPFEQVEESHTKKFKGSGLGLAITKQLVELHGSKLKVKSSPGEGSTFYFSINRSKTVPQRAEKPIEEVSSLVSTKMEQKEVPKTTTPSLRVEAKVESLEHDEIVVLIADDEPVNRRIMVDILTLKNYRTVEACDGEEAINILNAPDSPKFDLLILDVMMPKMSGFDVCKLVREQYNSLELPVLMVSAKVRSEDITTGLSAGANDYITKPIDRQEFIARVHTLVMLNEVSRARKVSQRAATLEDVIARLGKYFPKSIAEKLVTDDYSGTLAPNRRMITVIFADLAEFTTLTDRCEPEVIVGLLNEYLSEMGELIEQYNGTLNEILGDGLVVLFGAPDEQDKLTQIESSISLSIAMQKKMQVLSEKWLEDGIDHHVQLRIGIHQDFATVGNIGSKDFLAYRAVGSAVNLASRLQSESLPGGVVVSYPLYVQVKDKFEFMPLQEKVFKGFSHPHRYCQVLIE